MTKLFESIIIESLLPEPVASYDETVREYDDATIADGFDVILCRKDSDERLRVPFEKGESLASCLHRFLGILWRSRGYDYMLVDGDDTESTRRLNNFAEFMHFIRKRGMYN